jgi:hypothetical protein
LKHFLNQELLAPNVFTIPVDTGVVGAFADSDIRWISADTEEGFATFQSAFDRIDVAGHTREYLDLASDVRLYAGFLHTRSECSEPNFHVDWTLTNNEAFTLLTPVCGIGEGQSLLYKKLTGEIAEYHYKLGEAIVFGDHFIHSTPPSSCDPPFTILVFNFGTDKMDHWDKIRRTTGTQCELIRRPDGRLSRSERPDGNVVDNSAVIPERDQSIGHDEYQCVEHEIYRRAVELLEADVSDELVALDPTKGNCFGLNAVAKDVWRKLETPKSFDDLRSELLAEYDVGEEQCTEELKALLFDLAEQGLIESGPSTEAGKN